MGLLGTNKNKTNERLIMKKIICIACLTILFSCTDSINDNSKDVNEPKIEFSVSSVSDPEILSKVNSYKSTAFGSGGLFKLKGKKSVQFDLDNLQYVVMEGEQRGAIVAKQVGNYEEAQTRYALGFYLNEQDDISGALITKTQNIEDKILIISYYNLDGFLIEEVTIDSTTESIAFKNASNNKLSGIFVSGDCTGGEVVDCIGTMYTKLGWGSVSWWVGTALFSPGWVLGTVAGCSYVACVQ